MSHRRTIKHCHEPGDFLKLTFSCYRRMPLLTNDAWRCHSARGLDQALAAEEFHLVAFVAMPEHVHLLVWPTSPEATAESISRLLAAARALPGLPIGSRFGDELRGDMFGGAVLQGTHGRTLVNQWHPARVTHPSSSALSPASSCATDQGLR